MNQFDNTVDTQILEQTDLADENARLDEVNPEYTGETIEVNGVERTVYNSNGERIAKSEPALRNFWNWFGDSKVVDKDGRPLVVYHGTDAEFDTFARGEHGGTYGTGIYFGRKSTALRYGNRLLSVYLKIENPFVPTGSNGYRDLAGVANEVYQKKTNGLGELIYDDDIINWYLQDRGFDGIIDSKYIATGANEFVVFGNPELTETRQIIEKVLSMEPVSVLTGQEFQKDGTPLTTKVNDYYKENYNNEVYRDGVGTVKLDKRAIKDSAAHGIGKEKVAAFQAVPEVIKNGLIFDEQTQWKGRNYDSVSFIAPITINGERYTCEVIVKKSVEQNRFYLHEVEIEKKI